MCPTSGSFQRQLCSIVNRHYVYFINNIMFPFSDISSCNPCGPKAIQCHQLSNHAGCECKFPYDGFDCSQSKLLSFMHIRVIQETGGMFVVARMLSFYHALSTI